MKLSLKVYIFKFLDTILISIYFKEINQKLKHKVEPIEDSDILERLNSREEFENNFVAESILDNIKRCISPPPDEQPQSEINDLQMDTNEQVESNSETINLINIKSEAISYDEVSNNQNINDSNSDIKLIEEIIHKISNDIPCENSLSIRILCKIKDYYEKDILKINEVIFDKFLEKMPEIINNIK